MATGLETLTRALRDLGVLGADESTSTDDYHQVQGLQILIDLLDRLVDGFCDDLFVVSAAASATLGGNVRARATTSGITLTLPAEPNDGWRALVVNPSGGDITLGRNGHLLGATVAAAAAANATIANNASLDRFFRADVGAWISPTIAALATALPYPTSFDAGIAAMLTVSLASAYEMTEQVTPFHAALAQSTQDALTKRYGARR